jgi:hypothetical protein
MVASSHPGPGYVPIIIGGVSLILVALIRIVPEDSVPSKLLSSLLTRFGQYDLSRGRLAVVVVISIGLIALGITLLETGH